MNPLQSQNINIIFQEVSFSYDDTHDAIKSCSFELSSNETIAIVGANGAGKTTLVKLICGFYLPQKGSIIINGVPIHQKDICSWRNCISTVFQDFCSYAMTIEENIIMGNVFNEEKIDTVIEKSGLIDFIKKLPQGRKTLLGKVFGGTELSMGQWQKIAIARALYKDSDVYILDEPTASLDPISEYEIFRTFIDICQHKTTIVVTHRLNTVKIVDRILLMHQGQLIDQGHHNDLMKKNQLYKDMFNKQAKNYL